MKNKIRIIKEFPHKYTEQEIMEEVYNYFNGFDLEYHKNNNVYELLLNRANFTYCEDINPVLEKMQKSNIDINNYCFYGQNSSIFFSDAWFYYVANRVINDKKIDKSKLTILHIDDHSDMMDPFVEVTDDKYLNKLTNEFVDLNNLKDVERLIDTGAITIGSMLTPIIYTSELIKIIHVLNKCRTSEKMYITNSMSKDKVLFDYGKRMHIELNQTKETSKIYYSICDLDRLHYCVSKEELIILHIDMDYFNNRYNGSTAWKEGDGHHNPSLEEQKQKIKSLVNSLKRIMSNNTIFYTAIGISPSFYPSEYWQAGLYYLFEQLTYIGVNVSELQEELEMK